ncbi:SIR2 family protein [Mycobacterium sp. 21AC1]|uniref:SIR2 family protein n=1 Tax=[Mycobacterium] appelbergii TaxID=2939269 RepID=UPI002938DE43|nr:SIR2 family protein [Mycobacterium sp. 21AC1]MDV3129561.1 SIR2 family protein [Mycobacterium sp. 21AC1]
MPSGNLAMLVGNGLSIAFSPSLFLNNITTQVIARLSKKYEGRSDEVARAMQQVAIRAQAKNPSGDFESLIGAFGGQTDILDDLRSYALLTEDNHDMAQAISEVMLFVQQVRQRGIGHTLQIIVENSHPDKGSYASISNFLKTGIDAFPNRVTIANLNYDALVLTALTAEYKDDFCDMGEGWTAVDLKPLSDSTLKAQTLRTSNSFPAKRIKLIDLHGSVTFWKVGSRYLKIPLDIARDPGVWNKYREMQVMAFPLVVLANQHDKVDHVKRHPFQLAYDVADDDFRNSDHWLIAGYSFRDTCVNDLLKRAWDMHRKPPTILVVTKGDGPTTNDVENAFGWESGKFADHNAKIERTGIDGLRETATWKWFVGEEPPF